MRHMLRVALLGGGLGLLGGGLETIGVGMTTRLGLTFAEVLVLGLLAMAWGAALGAAGGLVAGLIVGPLATRRGEPQAWAIGAALTALGLAAFYVAPAVVDAWGLGRRVPAMALALCPLGLAGVVHVNALYWLRRTQLTGPVLRVGWAGVAPALGLSLVLVGASLGGGTIGGARRAAVEGDPNLLLITIDTLRRDHVGVYGEGRASTPRIDALAADGVVFWDAVTPIPETGPAHASMLTGLHPIRHRMLSNGHLLAQGHVTLAEALNAEGYATGAFLSSFAVDSRTGLDQGFQVFDDDFFPAVRGFSELHASAWVTRLLMAAGNPQDFPWLLERQGSATNRLALRWIEEHQGAPWFAWVHTFEPHAPYEGPDQAVDHRALLAHPDHVYTPQEAAELRRLYAGEATLADTQVGELLDALDAMGLAKNTMVIVTSDHGEQLGEHDIWFHHHGLYDQSVRVPLVIRAPAWRLREPGWTVQAQVRLMDLAPTFLAYAKLPPLENVEGVDLNRYALALEGAPVATTLYGRRTASLHEGTQVGLRTGAVKYIFTPDTAEEELYDLATDPDEAVNLVGDQAEAIGQARAHVARELEQLGGDVLGSQTLSEEERRRLEAMGYLQGSP